MHPVNVNNQPTNLEIIPQSSRLSERELTICDKAKDILEDKRSNGCLLFYEMVDAFHLFGTVPAIILSKITGEKIITMNFIKTFLPKSYESLDNDQEKLAQNCLELTNSIAELRRRENKWKTDREELQDLVTELKAQNANLSLNATKTTLSLENESLLRENEQLRITNDHLNFALKNEKTMNQNLQNQITDLSVRALKQENNFNCRQDAFEKTYKDKFNQMDHWLKEREDAYVSSDRRKENRLNEMQQQINIQTEMVSQLESQVTVLRSSRESLKAENEELKVRLATFVTSPSEDCETSEADCSNISQPSSEAFTPSGQRSPMSEHKGK